MTRPARRPSEKKTNNGPDALALLRKQLHEHRLSQRVRPETKHRNTKSNLSTEIEDVAALRSAMRDVTPIADPGRVELAPPKPSPTPRQKHASDDMPDDASPARRRSLPQDDDVALFYASMDDVVPLKFDNQLDLSAAASRHGKATGVAPAETLSGGVGRIDPASLLPAVSEKLSDTELFQWVTRGAAPIDTRGRAELVAPRPEPVPIKRSEDEQAALRETMEAPLSLEDRLEIGDEAAFLRPGLPRRVLTDLRRGRWVLQAELDLHGLNREQARTNLAEFLGQCLQRGHRCIRVIHGKGLGSPGKESILKRLARGWLAQREEILAFCQASPNQGGAGALMVLLRGRNPGRD